MGTELCGATLHGEVLPSCPSAQLWLWAPVVPEDTLR